MKLSFFEPGVTRINVDGLSANMTLKHECIEMKHRLQKEINDILFEHPFSFVCAGTYVSHILNVDGLFCAFDKNGEQIERGVIGYLGCIKDIIVELKKNTSNEECNPVVINCDKNCKQRMTPAIDVPAQKNALRVEAIIEMPTKCGCRLKPGHCGGHRYPQDYLTCKYQEHKSIDYQEFFRKLKS
jgi:hypothetical protein